MTTQHRRVITKILVSAAIALGSSVGAAAPASADPNAIGGTHPNLFGVLSCGCQEQAPPNSPGFTDHVNQGIQQGLTDPRVPH
jgi:hypothetical protein